MKFTTTTGELQRVLVKVSSVVPTKSTMPILENLLFDLLNNTLTITATDLEISQTISLDVKGSEDGKIAIPSKRLNDTMRSFGNNDDAVFSIDTTTNKITIKVGKGEFNLTGESAKEFPAVPPFQGKDEISLESAVLKRIIHRTVFAVSTDELRPAMMGVLLQPKEKELRAVATDGHRLVKFMYKVVKPSGLKRDIIIPAKALNIVNKSVESGSVTMSMNDTHVKFDFDKTVLVSRLIDETYPNYESVIPTENERLLTVNREQMVTAVRRVSLYASATTHQVKLSLRKNLLTISAQDVDFGGEAKEILDAEYVSDDLDIGFNSQYVVDILTHLDAEQVTFKFSSPTRAGIVSPAGEKTDEDVLMLVMPVRLNN
jgi:DNA polymerase III subunit beta